MEPFAWMRCTKCPVRMECVVRVLLHHTYVVTVFLTPFVNQKGQNPVRLLSYLQDSESASSNDTSENFWRGRLNYSTLHIRMWKRKEQKKKRSQKKSTEARQGEARHGSRYVLYEDGDGSVKNITWLGSFCSFFFWIRMGMSGLDETLGTVSIVAGWGKQANWLMEKKRTDERMKAYVGCSDPVPVSDYGWM